MVALGGGGATRSEDTSAPSGVRVNCLDYYENIFVSLWYDLFANRYGQMKNISKIIIFCIFIFPILLFACGANRVDVTATDTVYPVYLTQEADFKSSFRIIPILNSNIPDDALWINNKKNSLSAVTFCQFHCNVTIIFKEKKEIAQLYSSTFILGRPFTNLIWITDEILTFDQMSQPHYGVHYEVNIVEGKLLSITPFAQ